MGCQRSARSQCAERLSEALTIANSDLMAALGMLEARHIAGDQQLSFALIDGVRQ